MTSAERGVLVSFACTVIPRPVLCVSKQYWGHFVRDGQMGFVGSGNAKGWRQDGEFLLFLKPSPTQTKVSPDEKVPLILDNSSSHLSINGINLCREVDIVMLSFPPHCSRKLHKLSWKEDIMGNSKTGGVSG